MKKLQCKILGGDWFLDQLKGLTVTVTEIDLHCYANGGGFGCTAVLDDDLPEDVSKNLRFEKGGEIWLINSDNLEPLDTSMVPQTHNKSQLLRNVWIFSEARNDAWFRWQPKDIKKYEEENGVPWKDVRVYDIGMRKR